MLAQKLKVLDLFSGIGGFSLGLERTGGFKTVAFCEIEEFPRKVLKKHWPEVPCYKDVTKLSSDIIRQDGITVDVITGGFPCQDISAAGRKAGIKDGTRSGLRSEIVRLAGELRPKYLIVENVAELLNGPNEQRGGWFGRVLGDLADLGYNAEWQSISAAQIGAHHERSRVWIIAYPNCVRQSTSRSCWKHLHQASFSTWETSGIVDAFQRQNLPFLCGEHDGLSNGVDELKSIGNAVVPEIPEMIGHAILADYQESM